MTKEDLQPFIEPDTQNFWLNSVNPTNSDSLFIKQGVTNVSRAKALQNENVGMAIKAFLLSTYLVKGEYIISYMEAMVLTNRRLFCYYQSSTRSIALKNLLKYEQVGKLTVEYLEDGISQSFSIGSRFLKAEVVNNVLAKHKSDEVSEEEIIILSDTKLVLDGKYSVVSEEAAENIKQYERRGNRNGLIVLFAIILLVGGCSYYFISWNKSYEQSGKAYGGSSSSDNSHYNSVTGKKQHKCPWCGGIGRVGYAGDSKAQVDRTGMGLGNPCTTCNGTGWVDDDN